MKYFVFLIWLCSSGASAETNIVETPHVKVSLLAYAPKSIALDEHFWLGVKIEHQPHWHTYWKNPGDSGLPTTLRWANSNDLIFGDIQWPTPQRFDDGSLINFGYTGKIMLLIPIQLTNAMQHPQIAISMHAEWLVCNSMCIPESGDFSISIPTNLPQIAHEKLFLESLNQLPVEAQEVRGSGTFDDTKITLEITGLPSNLHNEKFNIFPAQNGVVSYQEQVISRWNKEVLNLTLQLPPQHEKIPAMSEMILNTKATHRSWKLIVPIKSNVTTLP